MAVWSGLSVAGAIALTGWYAIGPGHAVYAVVLQGGFLWAGLLLGPRWVDVGRGRYAVARWEYRLYTALGAGSVRRLLRLTGWDRVVRGMREELPARDPYQRLARGTELSETGHILGAAATALVAATAGLTGHWQGSAQILAVGLLVHGYPVMIQRMVRLRAEGWLAQEACPLHNPRPVGYAVGVDHPAAGYQDPSPGGGARTIDVNADAGESFGRWQLGADEEMAPLISSINVACGWHAGDPATMSRSVALAKEHGIALGAHPGFPDLVGFGRRSIAFSPDEAAQAVLYQFGALRALADREGVPVVHVKPHGSLYGLISRDDDVADAVADAVAAADPSLLIVLEAGPPAARQRERGHRVVAEAFADLDYTDDGRIIIDPDNRRRDPAWCADRAADILAGRVRSETGIESQLSAESICLHSDRPAAGDNARAVVERVRAEGWEVRASDPSRHGAESRRSGA